jgi:hypothetical protein
MNHVEASHAADAIRQLESVEPGDEYVVINLDTHTDDVEWYRGGFDGRLVDRQQSSLGNIVWV